MRQLYLNKLKGLFWKQRDGNIVSKGKELKFHKCLLFFYRKGQLRSFFSSATSYREGLELIWWIIFQFSWHEYRGKENLGQGPCKELSIFWVKLLRVHKWLWRHNFGGQWLLPWSWRQCLRQSLLRLYPFISPTKFIFLVKNLLISRPKKEVCR
jgi:hypothetical protein